jgi:hypothetical protein
MDRWLRGTALLFPWMLGALALALFATHTDTNDCDGAGLTSADHTYLSALRWAGGAAALATLLLVWLLARQGRSLRQGSGGARGVGFDAAMLLAALVLVVGLTFELPLLVPFLLAGYFSVVFPISPIAAVCAYVSACKSSGGSLDDPLVAQRFVKRALIFYSLTLVLVIPGVFALLGLRVSPLCLN